jgi:hypothetical protein
MAAIPQQHTSTEEKSPARAFWDGLMEKHPNLHGILSITGSVLGFFLNGHAVVKAGHWVVMTAGRIAETALLFATLWITAVNIAPDFITQLAGGAGHVSTLNALSLMAFSLLPEIIVFSAIVITYEHWQRFFRDRRASNPAWVWGSLYTLPTGTFLIMTVVTLGSFVSRDGAAAHITGVAIVIRCLAGWFYALVELIYITLGKRTGYTITQRQVEDRLAEIVATTRATLENAVATVVAQTEHNLATQVANIHIGIETKVASEVVKIQETFQRQIATQVATPPEVYQQGITDEQFDMLVELINQQAATIQQLSGQLTEVRREVRTTVTEIREIRSFSQDIPAMSTRAQALALKAGTITVEAERNEHESGQEKPGQRVLRFLQECERQGQKPTLEKIQEVCQVAKKTATTYRKSFYDAREASSQPEEEE